jgi:transcriptional regulator with XRE-family HTH domain
VSKFKAILREYIAQKGISQDTISLQIGDSQQAISDFLKKDGKPHEKTIRKYLEKLEGFKDYYSTRKLQVNVEGINQELLTDGKLSEQHKQIISDAFLFHEEEVKQIMTVKKMISAERLDAENNILREIKGLK